MKTTLNIDDQVMRDLKTEAARRGTTMSRLVEVALRQLLKPEPYAPDLPPLPTFRGGRELVDVSDREALYRVFDQD
ncbi:MAG: ribbon-helix-helix protein, CopG family [Candidatus Limnocylindrales bacterium]|jgi:plasmid stability protein